jgi:biopolymer transport protein TolQ
MDPNLVTAAPLATPEGAMSIWSLVMQADLVVKAVMLILALASLWCWAVIFEKAWSGRSGRVRRWRNCTDGWRSARTIRWP